MLLVRDIVFDDTHLESSKVLNERDLLSIISRSISSFDGGSLGVMSGGRSKALWPRSHVTMGIVRHHGELLFSVLDLPCPSAKGADEMISVAVLGGQVY